MLETALQLDPDYSDAMAYMNLLYRIEAGIAETPAESAQMVAKADAWVDKALDAKRRLARNPRQPVQPLNVDQPATLMLMAPPPPPPPPPPPSGALGMLHDSPGTLRVEGFVQAKKLVSQTPPVYPPQAGRPESGVVQLGVFIGKEGKVHDLRVLRSAGMEMDVAAMEAVKRWVYQPTLLNGEPMRVFTTVNVNFAR
jgi:TonB family protein